MSYRPLSLVVSLACIYLLLMGVIVFGLGVGLRTGYLEDGVRTHAGHIEQDPLPKEISQDP